MDFNFHDWQPVRYAEVGGTLSMRKARAPFELADGQTNSRARMERETREPLLNLDGQPFC